MLGNHTIFPPIIADTGSPEGVQLPRRGAGGGEFVGSEAGGDGGADDRSSARDSDQNAGSRAGGRKRKNVRRQTFEAITDVMDRHGQLMASTIDSSSKRQCNILTRQCDILEQEIAVQGAHYATSDETQKMMSHALMEIAAAVRGRSTISEALQDVVAQRQARPCLQGADAVLVHAARSVMHLMTTASDEGEKGSPRRRVIQRRRTDGDGWGRLSGTDDNDVFSTGAPDVQPPPLPSNVHAIAGGSFAQATTHDERIINVEVNEDARLDEGQGGAVPERSAMQPVTLPTTPRQQHAVVATGGATPRQAVPLPATPRQHCAGDNVGSGVAASTATAVEPPQPRHAGADVGVVAGAPRGATGEGRRGEDVASATKVARAEKKRAGEDDEPLVNRVRKGGLAKDLAERARLWVDDKSFWTSGEGRKLYNIINETCEHLVSVASGLPLLNVPRSVAMLTSNIAQIRIANAGHPAVCARTLDMGMDLPLWFVGVYIEDRAANDEMAAYQEAIVMRLTAAFSTAIETTQNVDWGRVAHKRLSRLVESFKELLAACMWIMRMAGDDLRSHYEAFYFTNMLAKPLLVASMHRLFNRRRHIMSAANSATERLGKAQVTLGHSPNFLPNWVPCGIKFQHDANLSGPDEARGLQWLGTRPAADDDDEDDE
ncbi:hypothetical protein CBR_g30293 [Chara braunii]|uniref:Uncharacterized protein n=1 Tax=Chara braunii TaxID=69332 RepID=A0A388JX21_CHABU|nr:hypothetical protein CBR_g30293 [Chara braunii]|eukprot:GBG62339.1 hypothetical protein CBR_g30293 [Chara braunii]